MKVNSIKFKICVIYVMILGVILIAYRGFLYFNLYQALYKDSNRHLEEKAGQIKGTIDDYLAILGNDPDYFALASRKAVSLEPVQILNAVKKRQLERKEHLWIKKMSALRLNEDYMVLWTANGGLIASSEGMDRELRGLFADNMKKDTDSPSFFNLNFKDTNMNLRVVNYPFYYGDRGKYVLQVGTSTSPIIRTLRGRFYNTAASIPIILLLLALFSWLLVQRILRPVYEIAKTAKDISRENLSARVNVENLNEEMKYLGFAFNDMIGRLEKSFKYIEDFNFCVVHELKTPLSIIKGESELALRQKRTHEEYRGAISSILEEAEKLLKTINDLLLLARLEYRSEAVNFEKFNLNKFLWEVYEQGRLLASHKFITIEMNLPDEDINIEGNKLHLRRLFFNLIDNAIKFTPREGRIMINADRRNGKVKVSVSDTGVGIAQEALPKIFRKFFTADIQNQECSLGTGLGLSIVKSITDIHSGDISVESQLGKGSTFEVTLPISH